MRERVEKLIADMAAAHSDRRLSLFSVRVDDCNATTVKLSGKVLETSHLHALLQQMPAGVKVDASGVTVLRKEQKSIRYIGTTLTNLHREPSWISELMTQFTPGTPLEILEDGERWCFVRMADGYLGYVYKPYTTEIAALEPTHLVASIHTVATADAGKQTALATRLAMGSSVRVTETYDLWARVEFNSPLLRNGWVQNHLLRRIGEAMRGEAAATQMIADAKKLTGTYYLWGGRSEHGIDCSGLCQLVHHLAGITIPRDADLQFAAGKTVDANYQPGDLMFFGGEPAAHAPRKVTHVGLSLGGWKIIHSSRSNNGVYEDDIQTVDHLRTTFCGARTFIR